MRCLRCIVQVYPKRMLVFRSVTITKVGNVEDSWCISLVDDKTQQSSSPPPLDMYCVTSNNSQNIANMCKTTLCATILLFCCTIGHSLVHVQCGAQGLRTNCGLSFLSTPLTKIFNTTPRTKIPSSAAHNRLVIIVFQPPGQPARNMISDWLMGKAEV